jgi:clan AA aspartic protease
MMPYIGNGWLAFCRESNMGVTHVTVCVSNLTQDVEPWEAEFLVDTGAIDCMAPRDRLLKAGIRSEGKAVYELANGQPVEYEYGFARVAFLGEETVTQIIFGPADAEPILGVVALENTGVSVDPIARTLRRMHAKPLK